MALRGEKLEDLLREGDGVWCLKCDGVFLEELVDLGDALVSEVFVWEVFETEWLGDGRVVGDRLDIEWMAGEGLEVA